MKKYIVLPIFILPIFTFAQSLTLKGKFSGLPDGTQITLTDLQNPVAPLAKATAKNGEFFLSTKLEAASLLGFALGEQVKTAVFFDNESINVSGAYDQKPDTWMYTGSKVQTRFEEFQNYFVPQFEQLNQLVEKIQMGDNSDGVKNRFDSVSTHIQKSVDGFITKYPASPVSTLAILSTINLTDDITLLEKRTAMLKPAALSNVFGGQLKKALTEAKFNMVGSTALDFSQTDTSGKTVSLSQFKGKYVLVDFWASWCGPCRKENHFLVKTFNKYKNENFTILGVSLDEEKKAWLKAIAKDELNWTHVSDLKGWENEVARQYRVTSIPRNFLVGPDGKILAHNLTSDMLDEKLGQIFRK